MFNSLVKVLVFLVIGMFAMTFQACKHEPQIDYLIPVKATPYIIDIPKGFPVMPIPNENPLTVEGVNLGKLLFYDTRLSGDNSQSCATCHFAPSSFSDSSQFSTGINGAIGNRNAMAIVNLGYSQHFFWDGRDESLEDQALKPVVNPIEMNTTWPLVLNKLNFDTYYREQFKIAFGVDVIDSFDVAKAIAQFERTMISGNSKFDQNLNGNIPLSDSETRGLVIFNTEKGDCFHCHGTILLQGFEFENNGVQQVMEDIGRGGVTNLSTDIGKFKPPTLRNIELSSPYMHDGRFKTLEEVVEFYNSGVNQSSPNISPLMLKANRPNGDLNLTIQDKADLVAFLKTLTDSDFISNPDFISE